MYTYDEINFNLEKTITAKKTLLQKDVDQYRFLMTHLYKVDVSTDVNYQKTYKIYWNLFGAGLISSFCDGYFLLLELLKKNPYPIPIEKLVKLLYLIPTKNEGKHSIQFSFSTKMLHMINPHLPIYDHNIATFYQFTPITVGSVDKKIAYAGLFYKFLKQEYATIILKGILKDSIAYFRSQFPESAEFTDERVIDYLIWMQ